jgi:uncharacterized protein
MYQPRQHTFLESLLYHLLPGVALLGAIFLLAALLPGWPLILVLFTSVALVMVPVELGILYYHGYRRNGRLSLEGIVLYRERISLWKVVLWALGTGLWSYVIFRYTQSYLNGLLQPYFDWLPPTLTQVTGNLTGYARGFWVATALVGLAFNGFIGPIVEEMYFRGFLLPRMERLKGWAPAANAVLFSLYHFFTPWENLTRIVALLPMVYAVRLNRSIWISMLAHSLLNTTFMIVPVIAWLG